YNVCPLCASTTMTDAAPVLGTPPDVRGCTSTSGAGAGRTFRGRGRFVACSFAFGVGSVVSTAEAFGYCFATPVGRMASGWEVCAKALRANAIALRYKPATRALF